MTIRREKRGVFTLSLDTELGWGSILNGRWRAKEQQGVYHRLRPVLDNFLALLDQLDLPCTWAIVGGMIEDDLAALKLPTGDYPVLKKIIRALADSEWETFHGMDVVTRILRAKIGHELAWHTQLHVPFDHPDVDEAFIDYDFAQARRVEARLGCGFSSFVFPQNRAGFHAKLGTHGVQCVRENGSELTLPYIGDRFNSFIKYFTPPPVRQIKCLEGEPIKTTGFFLSHIGLTKYGILTPALSRWRTLSTNRGIDRAVARGEHLHLYLHPFTLAEIPEFYRLTKHVLEAAAHQRDKGDLTILTMNQLTGGSK